MGRDYTDCIRRDNCADQRKPKKITRQSVTCSTARPLGVDGKVAGTVDRENLLARAYEVVALTGSLRSPGMLPYAIPVTRSWYVVPDARPVTV